MRLAFLAPKYKAYSEGWMWRDVTLLEDVIGYIGTLNSVKEGFKDSVPIYNLSTRPPLSIAQKIVNKIFNRTISNESVLEKNIIEYNIRHEVDCLVINFLNYAYQIKSIVKTHKNVFIHCHGYDVTWDMRSHERPEVKIFDDNYVQFVKQIARHVKFIANSEETKKRLLMISVPEENIFLKYFGVPLPPLLNKKYNNLNKIKILYTGRFVDCKGPELVIRAFEIVCKQIQHVELIMIGDGPLFITCQLLKERSEFKNQIHLLGAQSNAVVSEYMNQCDIFTAHNMQGELTKQVEAFGVTILEAMSYRLPIVTGSSGGPLEIVEDCSSGFLVTPGDIKEHAAKLLRLCNDIGLRHRMGERGREIIIEKFTLEKEKERFFEILTSGK